LEQEFSLGTAAQLPIEKADLHASPLAFIPEQDLLGILAREPIRGVDVEPLRSPGRTHIPQALQPGPYQGRPTLPFSEKLQLLW
jgi:hypothetical protein